MTTENKDCSHRERRRSLSLPDAEFGKDDVEHVLAHVFPRHRPQRHRRLPQVDGPEVHRQVSVHDDRLETLELCGADAAFFNLLAGW